ncbi:MAG: DUF302 domain-containing protein [Deltaproteobacteria bacterium]|nr:MAG: DUF302 domain-containing protein [Deltaproteobacteria bacterium]
MNYGIAKTIDADLDTAVERMTAALKEQGFGVLTTIDIRATLKKKLDVDFRPYVILGACNPPIAHKALTAEPHIGLFLPCNVVVQEVEGGTEVSFIDPEVMLQMASNDALDPLALDAKTRLNAALAAL